MHQVMLGTSGIAVSSLCLGCMYFGTRTDADTAFRLLDAYYDAGGRFLDTANNYAFWETGGRGGESETLLGQWMRKRGNRHEVILATKVGARPAIAGGGFESAEGLSARAIEQAVEESLRRLDTDSLDLYYAHIDHRATPLHETLAAFDTLVRAGKVRAVACSNMMAWRIAAAHATSTAHGWATYCGVQQRHSYLRPVPGADFGVQEYASRELLDYCAANDVTLLAYGPLLAGAYTRDDVPLPVPYRGPDSDARLATLAHVAAETGATPNQVVLAWMLRGTPTTIPLIAASTEAQLRENLGALDVALSPEQLHTLTAAAGSEHATLPANRSN